MNKKKIKIATAIVVALGLGFIFYNQTIPDEYVPDDNEIALHIQFDINEDIGLLVYDCLLYTSPFCRASCRCVDSCRSMR